MGRLLLVLGAGALVAVAGCGGSSEKSFSATGYPITFKYSSKLKGTEKVTTALNAGSTATDKRALALDSKNAILLSTYRLHVVVNDANIKQAKTEIDNGIQQVTGDIPRGKITHLDGLPTLEYPLMPVTPPKNGASRIAIVFAGRTEVELNCQSTPDRRADIAKHCDQMLATVKKR